MDWTSDEIRQLRYRLGWSQAEMARCLKLELNTVAAWELGRNVPSDEQRNVLLRILNQADMNSEKIYRRPLAEVMMRDRGLSQIHDLDVINGLDESMTARNGRGQGKGQA